jgi:hypothetical protein
MHHDLESPIIDAPPLKRYGWPDLVYGATPAAGAMFSQSVDGRYLKRLVSVFVRLVTSADVASRGVAIEYLDSAGARIGLSGAPVAQTASTTTDYVFSVAQPEAVWPVDSSVLSPLSPMLLLPTWSFRIYVANMQAADALSRIRYVRERFFSDSPV